MKPTVLLLGPVGVGKTVEVLRAFQDRLAWVCTEPGALDTAGNRLVYDGPPPTHRYCLSVDQPYEEAAMAVMAAARAVAEGRFLGVAIDTLSTLAEREADRMQVYLQRDAHGIGWGALASKVRRIVDIAAAAGGYVVAICHDREPSDRGPGGPALPGQLAGSVPRRFSLVLRMEMTIDGDGRAKRVFRCDPNDTTWRLKDRYGVIVDGEPADLRSVLQRVRRQGAEQRRESHGSV